MRPLARGTSRALPALCAESPDEAIMAKRKKPKRKTKTKAKKTKRRKSAARKKTSAKKSARKTKKTKRKTTARRKTTTRKKRRSPRRTEAQMSWPEVRASRRRKSAGREDRIVRDFDRAVNMTPQALEKWLKTTESHATGTPRKSDPSESVGHWSGRRILEIKKKNPLEYEPEDYAHMRKVTAYIARHGAQRPEGDVKDTRWRYSLMNWGHDPLK
jgi:hypothetical protein